MEGGVSCCCFSGPSGADAASASGAGGCADAAGAASAGGSTLLALALLEGTGKAVVLVTNLLDKGLAADLAQNVP